jgi:hypothetical protein
MISPNLILDKVKRIQELRRSNAAQPIRNKKNIIEKQNINGVST